MKTITIPQGSAEMCALFEQANEEDVVVQLADGRQFILSAIDDFDIEIAQTRRHEKLMKLLDRRAKQTKTISLEEVKHQLRLN
ncbi:MAG: hypothetical protein SW833_09420 [Cyanobacteriota bacterium]|nr:hypothetical protein [Cyanobacteriota bacterium]